VHACEIVRDVSPSQRGHAALVARGAAATRRMEAKASAVLSHRQWAQLYATGARTTLRVRRAISLLMSGLAPGATRGSQEACSVLRPQRPSGERRSIRTGTAADTRCESLDSGAGCVRSTPHPRCNRSQPQSRGGCACRCGLLPQCRWLLHCCSTRRHALRESR